MFQVYFHDNDNRKIVLMLHVGDMNSKTAQMVRPCLENSDDTGVCLTHKHTEVLCHQTMGVFL